MIAAEVFLWGTRIGVVLQEDAADVPRFNYDSKFIRSGIEVSPLMMPLSGRIYSFPELNVRSFYGLPGLLADSLPDKFGNKLIERYLADQGRSVQDFSAVERLCYTGTRGMGALEYVPALGYEDQKKRKVDLDALVQLASDILTERDLIHVKADDHAMEQILQIGTSAGGARAKAVIAWNRQTGDIRSGQVEAGDGYEYWLIKFDGVKNNKDKGDKADAPSYTRIEYAYYLMAKEAGIKMSHCELYEDGGRYHFLTKRFDKDLQNRKLHMHSLGGMAHFDFNEPGLHSYEQACDVIYRLGMGQPEVEELFRRMVFNVLGSNLDDHVKNISFLMDRSGEWHLAPAYDVTYAFDPGNFWLARHQMSVNGKTEHITESDLKETGSRMNISKRKTEKIINQVQITVSKWETFAEKARVPEEVMAEIRRNLMM